MTTTSNPAANGGKKRLTGLDKVREAQAWHDACLLNTLISEADTMCREIYSAVSDAYQPAKGESNAREVAASYETSVKASAARELLEAALRYLDTIISQASHADCGDEPF